MFDLPGFLLNNLASLSLNPYLALIFPTTRWWNGVKWLQIWHIICIVAKVFGNIKNWFSAHNWLVFGWYVRYLAGLWVGWLVFGWFVDGLAGLWVVWLVWLVRGWFRVLQLTHFKKDFLKNYLKEINRFRSGKTEEKKQVHSKQRNLPKSG